MKRTISILCCIALLMGIFAGCGETPASSMPQGTASQPADNNNSSDTTDVNTGTDTYITDEKITLTYWRAWSNDYTPDFNEYDVIKEMEEKTNVNIKYITVPSSTAVEKYGLLLASGNLPDMIENNADYPGGGEKAIGDNVYIDMAPYVETIMPNYKALRESDEDVRRMTITDTGKMWGIYPFFCNNNMELCLEPIWVGVVIRQDWLDDLNLDKPSTMDQWHEVLTAFKNEKNAEAPLLLSKSGIMNFDYFLSAYGVMSEFYKDGNTVKYGPMEEGYRQYLEMMAQWYKEGLVDQNFISNEVGANAPPDYIATGKAGVGTLSWAATTDYYVENGSATDPNLNLAPIPGPVLKEGEVCQARSVGYIALTPVSVTTNCDYPEIAAKWLDFQYTKDGFEANSFGAADCFTYENGEYKFTDKIMKSELGLSPQVEQFSHRRKDHPGLVSWEVYDQVNPAERLAAREVYDADGTDLVLPKIELTYEEGTEYNNLYTDILTYVQEKTAAFIMGIEPIENFPQFVEKLENMNIEKCIELQQAALDRYNSR